MIKCEVLDTCSIVVGKGSIVEVSPRQYELARKFLKPVNDKKEEKAEVKEVETAELPKAKKTRKK